jgi:hypothetical protein
MHDKVRKNKRFEFEWPVDFLLLNYVLVFKILIELARERVDKNKYLIAGRGAVY